MTEFLERIPAVRRRMTAVIFTGLLGAFRLNNGKRNTITQTASILEKPNQESAWRLRAGGKPRGRRGEAAVGFTE